MILAIDPGPEQSACVLLGENLRPLKFGKVDNPSILPVINDWSLGANHFVVEMIASYGMPVGAEVFETALWIGRFWQKASTCNYDRLIKVYRKEVKMNLCQSMKAKDSNIRQALIDRFGVVGTKKAPGWFYGVSKDVWSAIAVGVTYADMYLMAEKEMEG